MVSFLVMKRENCITCAHGPLRCGLACVFYRELQQRVPGCGSLGNMVVLTLPTLAVCYMNRVVNELKTVKQLSASSTKEHGLGTAMLHGSDCRCSKMISQGSRFPRRRPS